MTLRTRPIFSLPPITVHSYFFFLIIPPPPTTTLFPYTTLFRPRPDRGAAGAEGEGDGPRAATLPFGREDDRGRRRHPGQGAVAAPARGSESHLKQSAISDQQSATDSCRA